MRGGGGFLRCGTCAKERLHFRVFDVGVGRSSRQNTWPSPRFIGDEKQNKAKISPKLLLSVYSYALPFVLAALVRVK